LEAKFAEFPAAIFDTHGKDLTISAEASRTGSPSPNNIKTPVTSAAPPAASLQAKKLEEKVRNTKIVTVTATFRADAERMFNLLTGHDEFFFRRVGAPPQVWKNSIGWLEAHHTP
jgi:hypothetical protein